MAAVRAGYQRSAILRLPLSLGCTPSGVSVAVLKPVHWSTTVTGEAAVLVAAAHAGIAALRSITRWVHSAQLAGVIGRIWATRIFIAGLAARIWPTSLVNAARIVAGERLFQTSLVPKCIITTSG